MSERFRILVVDDEVELGFLIKQLLEMDGYQVTFVSDPHMALDLLDNENYSIIVSDYNMPGLNGQELFQCIRAKGLILPVVFLTGMATKDFVISALRLGASDVLEKPCPKEVLSSSLGRILEIERRRAEIYQKLFSDPDDPNLQGKLRMLGLMMVANQRKAF